MNHRTHVSELPSGVEFEVKELTGKHQRLLTEQVGNKTMTERLNEVLAEVLVRVGSNTEINEDFVKKMLACDKQKALVDVRQFTMDFEKAFQFTWEYTDDQGMKQDHKLEIPLDEGNFPWKPVMAFNKEGELVTMKEAIVDAGEDLEYDSVLSRKAVEIILPRAEMRVRYTMLDGEREAQASKIKKNDRSSHSVLKVRTPVRFGEGDTPIQINLDTLAYKDIEYLRSDIKKMEGSVDTEIRFEHPEADSKPPSEKDVVVDLLGTIAFFFPSEAI